VKKTNLAQEHKQVVALELKLQQLKAKNKQLYQTTRADKQRIYDLIRSRDGWKAKYGKTKEP
jgi:flagellar biosynthesis/type III secretory pathway chaperone